MFIFFPRDRGKPRRPTKNMMKKDDVLNEEKVLRHCVDRQVRIIIGNLNDHRAVWEGI